VTVTGISHVQLAAPMGCEEKARAYFGRLLGLRELSKPDALAARGGVWFAAGAQEIHIGVEPDFHPARKAHPAFEVDDLAALRQRMLDADCDVHDDDSVPGLKRFFSHDPFGNRVEFVQR
jgi:catechol 2,3-dioxygenase-like lactoylglutathione lyase family enzyme